MRTSAPKRLITKGLASWLGTFVANLGAAFFFVSYFTGQFVRVKRQATVEGTLHSLTAKLVDLTTSVGNLTTIVTQALAREPALQPIAQELSDTHAKLAQANTVTDYVPAPPPSPKWPPSSPKATGTSN
jgi:hypothetical protein